MKKLSLFLVTLVACSLALANSKDQIALIKSFRKGDMQRVEQLVNDGVELNYEMGLSPLVMAVRSENLALVDMMIKAGADVDFIESQPANALISAASTGNEALIDLILAENPDLDTRASSVPYRTALMQASESGHLNIVTILVDAGADLHIGDYYDDHALAFAVYFDRPDIVDYLIATGAKINHISQQNRTPLDHARRNTSSQSEPILLAAGAKSAADTQ